MKSYKASSNAEARRDWVGFLVEQLSVKALLPAQIEVIPDLSRKKAAQTEIFTKRRVHLLKDCDKHFVIAKPASARCPESLVFGSPVQRASARASSVFREP